MFVVSEDGEITLLWTELFFCSVAQSCPTLSDPMDCSTPGYPVHHQLPELAQTHSYLVADAIESTSLLCLEGVPDLPVAPQDEAGLTKTFQTWPRGWFHIP